MDDEIAAMERKLAALKAAKAGGKKVPDTSSLIPPNPNVEGPSDTRTGKKIDLEAEIQKAAMDKAPGSEDDGRIPALAAAVSLTQTALSPTKTYACEVKRNGWPKRRKLSQRLAKI